MLVQRLAGDAGLDHAVEILGVNFQHPVHVAQVDADAAGRRVDLSLQRRAGAESNHGNSVFRANPHHILDVRGLLGHDNRVWRLRCQPRRGMGVLIAHRLGSDQPVAEPRGQRFNGTCQRLRFRTQIIGYGYAQTISSRLRADRGKGYIRGQGTGIEQKGWVMTTITSGDDVLFRPAPFLSSVMQIEPQWIDYNGHLNMAYYNVMFDRAIDELWIKLGIGPGYMKDRQGSSFTAECHVRYLREIHLSDPVQISILLVAADEKRLHTFEELRHAGEGWLSATSENMTIHIDMNARKTAPFPPDIRARIQALANAHGTVPRPEGIGRKVGMPAR